ncbi:hypothetical protein [Anaerotruncus sp. DFI.9.16]|nr:hypothetical protein [Anaerotruncus sp. DFI.9.16]MCQ4897184.1 hypothetical protein [Anaerotruncus sp. DFI.9.16]
MLIFVLILSCVILVLLVLVHRLRAWRGQRLPRPDAAFVATLGIR